jgi:hypothetical protein
MTENTYSVKVKVNDPLLAIMMLSVVPFFLFSFGFAAVAAVFFVVGIFNHAAMDGFMSFALLAIFSFATAITVGRRAAKRSARAVNKALAQS